MPSIFVSHAAKDERLVEEFVELLQVGIGVHPNDIFCSSLPGMNIPTGTAFIDYIKSKITSPKLVLLVVSQEFLKSQFCHNEVGATWALSLPIYPMLVPPVDYPDVRGVLGGIQLSKIDDKEKLNDLRDDITAKLGLTPLKTSHWEKKRDKFLDKLPSLQATSGVPVAAKIPTASSRANPVGLVVKNTGSWLKLDSGIYNAERFEHHGAEQILVQVLPESAEQEAALNDLRRGQHVRKTKVGFAYQNEGGMARIEKVTSTSQGDKNVWSFELVVEDQQWETPMSYNTGNRHYTPDDFAEMRAGRMLINNPPPPRRSSRGSTEGFLESMVFEPSGSPVDLHECIIQRIASQNRDELETALIQTRLEAIYRLKAAGVVENVLELNLGPLDGDKLHVRFRGRRPKRSNEEPETITIEGDCQLG